MLRDLLLCLLALILGTAPARADSSAAFPRGTKEFTLAVNYVNERKGRDRSVSTVTTGFGYYFLDNAAIELQLLGYRTHDEEDGYGPGANLEARYHLLNIGRFSLYGEIAGGVLWTSADFPTGGTELNFTYFGGPGVTIRLNDNMYLLGGVRFQHLSNLFIEGRDRNPIFNSYGGFVGLMWKF